MKKRICLIFLVFSILYIVFGVSNTQASTLYFLHQDHLGSTSLVTDSQGRVVSQQVYYPYGETRSYSQLTTNYSQPERQYTGQISDQDQTGLYYYNARYYNPTLAKFTQADITNDNLNKYSYVGNNPIVNTDPSGNQCTPGYGRGHANCPQASFSDLANVTSIYLFGLGVVAPPLLPVIEAVDTTLCIASGGGPECAQLGPTGAYRGADEVVDAADNLVDDFPSIRADTFESYVTNTEPVNVYRGVSELSEQSALAFRSQEGGINMQSLNQVAANPQTLPQQYLNIYSDNPMYQYISDQYDSEIAMLANQLESYHPNLGSDPISPMLSLTGDFNTAVGHAIKRGDSGYVYSATIPPGYAINVPQTMAVPWSQISNLRPFGESEWTIIGALNPKWITGVQKVHRYDWRIR